jgi:lysophospholipase L1-like esterase
MVEQIRANTPQVTGKMAKSVGYVVNATNQSASLQITAAPFFRVVETGRKATPNKKPSRAMIENIGEWLKALGKEQKLAWAIATKINKEGTKLWQAGGRTDVFSNVLDEKNIRKMEVSLRDAIAEFYLRDFLLNLKKLKLSKN